MDSPADRIGPNAGFGENSGSRAGLEAEVRRRCFARVEIPLAGAISDQPLRAVRSSGRASMSGCVSSSRPGRGRALTGILRRIPGSAVDAGSARRPRALRYPQWTCTRSAPSRRRWEGGGSWRAGTRRTAGRATRPSSRPGSPSCMVRRRRSRHEFPGRGSRCGHAVGGGVAVRAGFPEPRDIRRFGEGHSGPAQRRHGLAGCRTLQRRVPRALGRSPEEGMHHDLRKNVEKIVCSCRIRVLLCGEPIGVASAHHYRVDHR